MSSARTRIKRIIRAVIGRERWAWIARKLDPHPPPLGETELAAALKRAQRLLETGRGGEARAILDGAWRPHRIRPPRRRQMAVLYQKAGALPESLRDWRHLLRKLPRNKMALKRIRDLEARIATDAATRDLERGNHPAALRVLGGFLTKRPGHPAATRLLMAAHIRSGNPGAAEALVEKALAAGKGSLQAMANLAMAYESAGAGGEAGRVWQDLAGSAKASWNVRIGRIHKGNQKTRAKSPKPEAVRRTAAGPLAEWDEAFRIGDEKPLQTGLERMGDIALKEYFEIKQLNRATGCEEAAERVEAFLRSALPARLAGREMELREIQWWSLARLGRYQDAVALLDRLALDPQRRAAAELDVWWRTDPARGLALVPRLWESDRDPERFSLLFCALPWILNDLDTAAKHLGMDLARREHHRLPVPNDLLLCAAVLERGRGGLADSVKLFSRFFNRQKLETPDGLSLGFDDLSLDLPTYQGGPLVTVILTAHNAARTVGLALRSLLAQSHARIEVIVVDDASSDETMAAVLDASRGDGRVLIYQNRRNVGTYVSKNFAMERARGEFITFMDADDWAHPRRVERHLARMRIHPRLVATTSDWIRVDDSFRPQLRPRPVTFTHMNPGSFFFRREMLQQVGFFDRVRIDGDLDYLLRARACYGAAAVGRIAAVLTIGRFRDDSLTRSGVGAQGVETYSQIRADYRVEAFRWRRERNLTGGSLYLGPDGGQRDLQAARVIRVDHPPDAIRIRGEVPLRTALVG